ncbi:MAG: OmpA family protein [Pigmentiphaga sp.]|uniref:OmpA family protein n=1 Tax=Pigmentiphaga sp. TaxID=1977564 RepID=UPI0029B979B4|nr:OmpA family protein [Pigmentiphaga sp.]MDX3906509.1 OmpA family protein [Pigmentiphaga sp.]
MRIATVAALMGTLILAACSAPPKSTSTNPVEVTQDPSGFENINVPVSKMPPAYLRNGTPLDANRFAQVKPGASRQAVMSALGEPVHRSPDGRSYYYNLALPLQGPGDGNLVCQYRVNFDAAGLVTSGEWRRPQCQVLASAMRPVAQPAPAPAPVRTISMSADVLFEFASARLRVDGQRELDRIVASLRNETLPYEIQIVGHSDRIGSEQINRRLSLQRAQAVRDYLIGRGLSPSGLSVDGRGSAEPVAQCQGNRATEELKSCLAPNRRVTLNIRSVPGARAR